MARNRRRNEESLVKDGTTGFKGVLSAGFDKFVESGKELGGKLVELAKRSPAENIEAAKESFANIQLDSKREFLHWGEV